MQFLFHYHQRRYIWRNKKKYKNTYAIKKRRTEVTEVSDYLMKSHFIEVSKQNEIILSK